ncbi:MAG TPA: hypothetical protein VGO45_01025 [Bacteroidia bacterium]|jgi:hypothetical protein|nr:hypothetical protein [Bacteroidia bacterium]
MSKKSKTPEKSPRPSLKSAPASLFDRMEASLSRNHQTVFGILCFLCILVSLLLFSARLSEGGDDSTYIQAGWEYSKNFFHYYFNFNAPFYPMFLSLPIKIFGINLLLLKALSLPMHFFALYFFYKAFNKRIPYLILFPVLFFIAVNATLQYFASQTNNEAFYMFWQSLFFYVFVRLHDRLEEGSNTFASTWKLWLAFGILSFLLTFAKNIAVCMVPVLPLYFLVQKQWKNAGYALGSFLVVKLSFEGLKTAIWGNFAQYKSQGGILLLKDPYDASKGTDDVMGFVGRFFDNCNIYLSKRFFQILGLRDPESTELYSGLAFLVALLLVVGLIAIIRSKNKFLLFAALYTLSITAGTFIVLQARWDQPRMIILQMPFLLMVLFYGIYALVKKGDFSQNLYVALILLLGFSLLGTTSKQSAKNIPVLSKNLRGDMYYGFTPDWVNFLKMSRWCADSLPENTYVASRKAPMSFIYGKGKKFFPVYKVLAYDTATKQSNPDTLLAIFRKEKVTHMLIASIRMDPQRNTGNVINTLHNMIQPLMQKYPAKVILVHQEGEAEAAYLYEIRQ